MNVTTGTRLGPYEIVARLGAGGMGEVWSALDTRLDRRVAVKILPPELADDAQFKLRFEREARTISQLSHPNICTLFDVGEGFLVMELLEGETLADRITRGPLPMADVLRYGLQIAEALGKAHRMGIVHRDLKPANVMITKSGAKLLDFGLAKSSAGVVDLDGATQHKPLTREGTILGTFQYMAPEQLEGNEADARTDIFALGALLYEMATGQRAFDGKTKTSLIALIVSGEPRPLREMQPLTPPAFEHVVARCMNKDPEERWQSAQDIAEELRWAATTAAELPAQRSKRAVLLPWIVTAAVVLASVAVIALLRLRTPSPRVSWSDIASPPELRIASPSDRGGSAIAPDGNRIVISGIDGQGRLRLYLRDLRKGDIRPIADTDGAGFPFWSPDSRSIAFFTEGKLKRIEIDGTRATVVANDVDGRGGTWAPDGTIVFAASSTSGLSRVRATGGVPKVFIERRGDQSSLRFPSFLPDGKHFLFVAQGHRDRGIHVASLDGRLNRKLIDAQDSGIVSARSILFLREGALFAQELDIGSLEPTGEPRQIASGVGGKNAFASSGLSVSLAGDVLFPAEFTPKTALVWRDRAGAILRSLVTERMLSEPAFSPDEKRVVATSDDPPGSLWEVDLERGRSKRFSLGDSPASTSSWSQDGTRIAMNSSADGKSVLAVLPASGGKLQILTTLPQTLYPESWSPDDTFLVLNGPGPNASNFDLWALGLKDRKVRPLLASPANEARLQFSPGTRFISYSSDETGRAEIFVRSWPLSENKWQVSTDGGDQAYWRGDGKELFYLAPDGKLMSVAIEQGESISFGDPVVLFQTPLSLVSITGNRNQYLTTRDGQRFLFLEPTSASPPHLTLVQNFPLLLKAAK